MSPTTSAAVAPPRLTIQFACSVEICAPPRIVPFRPTESMSRPAWSPGGLVKTLPQLGWLSGWVRLR